VNNKATAYKGILDTRIKILLYRSLCMYTLFLCLFLVIEKQKTEFLIIYIFLMITHKHTTRLLLTIIANPNKLIIIEL